MTPDGHRFLINTTGRIFIVNSVRNIVIDSVNDTITYDIDYNSVFFG